jgi:hypothetical protein
MKILIVSIGRALIGAAESIIRCARSTVDASTTHISGDKFARYSRPRLGFAFQSAFGDIKWVNSTENR